MKLELELRPKTDLAKTINFKSREPKGHRRSLRSANNSQIREQYNNEGLTPLLSTRRCENSKERQKFLENWGLLMGVPQKHATPIETYEKEAYSCVKQNISTEKHKYRMNTGIIPSQKTARHTNVCLRAQRKRQRLYEFAKKKHTKRSF